MTHKGISLVTAVASALFAGSAAAAEPIQAQPFDRAAWKADLGRIKFGLAEGYANLDWQIEKRGFNPVRASQQLNVMLDRVNSDVEAVVVLTKLVDALHDPHLQLLPGPPPDGATLLPRQSDVEGPIAAAARCKDARYSDGKTATPLPYDKSSQWRAIASAPFQAGLIGTIGVVRIPSFAEQRYAAACAVAAKRGVDSRELQLAARAELNRQLVGTIKALRTRGANRLIVDISGNGGGSEWSSEAAAMFAAGTLTRNAPRLAKPACDRSVLWSGEKVCSIYDGRVETEQMKGTAVWTGPLAVLTDRRSASAAEEFVTWLKDNHRAIIAGEQTSGAGCGYVDGGHAVALKAARLTLMMPNCSRYTRDGLNEIEGIPPTVPLEWTIMTPEQSADALRSLFRS